MSLGVTAIEANWFRAQALQRPQMMTVYYGSGANTSRRGIGTIEESGWGPWVASAVVIGVVVGAAVWLTPPRRTSRAYR